MPRVGPKVATWQTVRMCPCCGYRGAELQGASGQREVTCGSCGGDLYTRPPRSYAEMEEIPDDDASSLEPVWLEAIPAAVLGDSVFEAAVTRRRAPRRVWGLVWKGMALIGFGFALGAACWSAFGTM
ncbi:MAG: hypothetical protein AB7G17_02470 [Phycisphaerales bacterium]